MKIKKYIICILFIILTAAMIWKICEPQQNIYGKNVQLTVIAPKDSEKELSDIMDGIRSCAKNNKILINMVYGDGWTGKDWNECIKTEYGLNSKGILILYPENIFYERRADKDFNVSYGNLPVVCLSNSLSDIFPFSARFNKDELYGRIKQKNLSAEEIEKIKNRDIKGIWIPNWYQMGYRCIQALYDSTNGSPMENITAEYILISQSTLNDGSYDALLEK